MQINRIAIGRWLLVAFAVLVALGCGQNKAPVTNLIGIENLKIERASLPTEWRNAYRVSAGVGRGLRIPLPSSKSSLRLGVLSVHKHERPAFVYVDAGGREQSRIKLDGNDAWVDEFVELPPASKPNDQCVVSWDSDVDLWFGPCEVVSAKSASPNVLVILVDTLRKDHLGCYGYTRDTSPNIDAFAHQAILFTEAIPQSSWTRPSVASILTSTYPNFHGAEDQWDIRRADVPTIAGTFTQAAYEAQGFMSNPNCLPVSGFGQEFTRYVDVNTRDWKTSDDGQVTDAVLTTLKRMATRPWMIYAHYLGPHGPYLPRPPYDTKFRDAAKPDGPRQHSIDLYDGEVAFTDAALGRLFAEMRSEGTYDDTLIVLTADHGEEFWEHGGTEHGTSLYEEEVRIPLIVKMPKGAHPGERRDVQIEMVDLAPTLLDIAGISPEPRFQGRSFLSLIEGKPFDERAAYSSLDYLGKNIRAARLSTAKYVHNLDTGAEEWFDLEKDPGDYHPLRDPIPGVESLKAITMFRGVEGADGLHVTVTCAQGEIHKIKGTILGGAPSAVELQFPDIYGKAEVSSDRVSFSLDVGNYSTAHLVADVKADDAIGLEIAVDEAVLTPDHIFVGRERRPMTAAGTQIVPKEFVADPAMKSQVPMPKSGVSVYVWYVPSPGTFTRQDIDPSIRDSLEALGYIGS